MNKQQSKLKFRLKKKQKHIELFIKGLIVKKNQQQYNAFTVTTLFYANVSMIWLVHDNM